MNTSKQNAKLLFIIEKLPIHGFTRNNIPTVNNEFYSLKAPEFPHSKKLHLFKTNLIH